MAGRVEPGFADFADPAPVCFFFLYRFQPYVRERFGRWRMRYLHPVADQSAADDLQDSRMI